MRRRIADANGSKRLGGTFRVVHFSVQNNHVHLIVEAHDGRALSCGVQGLAIRLARRVNKLLGVSGRFWSERFHSRELATPRSVRNAIVYVLMNARKHHADFERGVDACSSAPWFDGFVYGPSPPREESPVKRPSTWLASTGWRRCGLIGLNERPREPG